MIQFLDKNFYFRVNLSATLCTLFVLGIGISVLAGWYFHIPFLKSIAPGYITMKVNTALCFLFLAGALWNYSKAKRSVTSDVSATLLCLATTVICALTLMEYLWGFNFKVDEFLFNDPDGITGKFPPGRLAPVTAVNFIMLSIALLLSNNPFRRFYKSAHFLTLIAFILSFQGIIGYLTGISYSFGLAFYTQMALHTALAFTALCFGIFVLQPKKGLIKIFFERDAGGFMARRMIIAVISIPPLVNYLQHLGQNHGLYDENMGTLIRVISSMCFMTTLVWLNARRLHELERQRKISERERFTLEADYETTQLKNNFFTNISHEIRTPLAGILGVSDLLSLTTLDLEQKKQVQIISDAGERLMLLINDILDYSKIGSGMLSLECADFDLRSAIDLQTQLLLITAKKKSIHLLCQISEDVPDLLRGDQARIGQVLLNLIGNALKFTEYGQVKVSVSTLNQSESHSTLKFVVSDTGIGLSEKAKASLFKPFTQADDATSRKYGGTGLGLSISKGIIEQMGGKIGVESELGKGCHFWFIIKLEKSRLTNLNQSKDKTVALPLNLESTFKVLVVEDNAVNQMIISGHLKALNISHEIVTNGREALRSYRASNFNLILMDIHMPEMNGYEASKSIRELEKEDTLAPIYICALTASTSGEDRQLCLDHGMNDYISKPIRKESLIALIQRCSTQRQEAA